MAGISLNKTCMKQEDYNGYKAGALKRKFGLGRTSVEPGTFISLAKESAIKNKETTPDLPKEKLAIMGLV